MFGKQWEPASAVVIATKITGNRPDGTVNSEEIVVDVYPCNDPPFRALAATPRIATDFRTPAIGATVRVEYDRRSGRVRFTKHDPATSRRALVASVETSLADVLHQPPGTEYDPAADQLQRLFDTGVFGGRSAAR